MTEAIAEYLRIYFIGLIVYAVIYIKIGGGVVEELREHYNVKLINFSIFLTIALWPITTIAVFFRLITKRGT